MELTFPNNVIHLLVMVFFSKKVVISLAVSLVVLRWLIFVARKLARASFCYCPKFCAAIKRKTLPTCTEKLGD